MDPSAIPAGGAQRWRHGKVKQAARRLVPVQPSIPARPCGHAPVQRRWWAGPFGQSMKILLLLRHPGEAARAVGDEEAPAAPFISSHSCLAARHHHDAPLAAGVFTNDSSPRSRERRGWSAAARPRATVDRIESDTMRSGSARSRVVEPVSSIRPSARVPPRPRRCSPSHDALAVAFRIGTRSICVATPCRCASGRNSPRRGPWGKHQRRDSSSGRATSIPETDS